MAAPSDSRSPASALTPLSNPDLAALPCGRRSWGPYGYFALWVCLCANPAVYLISAGLVAAGMDWLEALFTVFLGALIALVPLLLLSQPGARYGIPFPVLARGSFGVLGAHVPALLRAAVACVWFGVQTWLGGEAANVILGTLAPGWNHPWLCLLAFWILNLVVAWRGVTALRRLEAASAPILLALAAALLLWAWRHAGGFGPMLSAPSRLRTSGEFFRVFVPAFVGVVVFWPAVSLSISDFTRYARGPREHLLGQAIGLPAAMTFFAFVGVAVASATVVIFGHTVWDPAVVLGRLGSRPAVALAMAGWLLAVLNVNVAANLVSPSNAISNLAPRRISARSGAVLTSLIGLFLASWMLVAAPGLHLSAWLTACAGLLGPIAGILIADYFIVRKTILLSDDLYAPAGFYEFFHGVNWRAVAALLAGLLAALATLAAERLSAVLAALTSPDLQPLHGSLVPGYPCLLGFAVSFVFYLLLMRRP